MSGREAIANTLARYAWAFDRDELDLIGACFTPDARGRVRHRLGDGPRCRRGGAATPPDLYRPTREIPWHVISNVRRVTSVYTFFEKAPGEAPPPRSIGHYDDPFVVEDGAWRIRSRSVVVAG